VFTVRTALNWEPLPTQSVSDTLTLRLTGQAFKNVEIFNSGRITTATARRLRSPT